MTNNTIGALKAIYTALGGNSSTVATKNTIPDMLTAIAAQLTAVGITDNLLPAVSAIDNGKILKVADGKWGVGTDLTK